MPSKRPCWCHAGRRGGTIEAALTLTRQEGTGAASARSYARLLAGTLHDDQLLVNESLVLEHFSSPYTVKMEVNVAGSCSSAHRLVASVVHDWLVGKDVTSSLVLPSVGSQRVGPGCPSAAHLPGRPVEQQQATPLRQRARNEQPQACASMQKPPRKARQESLQAALAKQQERQVATAAASAAPASGFSLADRLNAAAGPAADTADGRAQVEQTQASGPQELLGQQQTLRILRDSAPPSSHIFGLPSGQPSWAPSMLLPAVQQPAAAPALAATSAALGPGFGGQPNDRALPHGQQAHSATARERGHEPAERQMALSSASGSQGCGRWLGSSQEGAGGAVPATQQGHQGQQAHPATTGDHMHQPAHRLMALSDANGRQAWGSWPSNAQRSAGAAPPVVEGGIPVAAAPLGAGVLEVPAITGRQGQAARSHDMAATAAGQDLSADPALCPAAAVPQPGKRKLTMFTSSSWEHPAKLAARGTQSQDDSGLQRPLPLPGAARLSPQRRHRDVKAAQVAAKWPGHEQASLQARPTQAPADAAPAGTSGAWQMSGAGELPVAGQKPACTPQQEGPRNVSPAKDQHRPQSAAALARGLPAAAAAAAAAAGNVSPATSHCLAYKYGDGRLQQGEQAVEEAMLPAGPCGQGLGPLHSGAAEAAPASKPGASCRLAQTYHGEMHSQPSLADSWPAGGFGGASGPTPQPDEAASMQAGQNHTPAPKTDSAFGRGAASGMPSRQLHLSPRAQLCVAARRQGGQLAAHAQHSPPSVASRSSLSQQAAAFAKFSCTAPLSQREHVCSHHHPLPFARQHLHGLLQWLSS